MNRRNFNQRGFSRKISQYIQNSKRIVYQEETKLEIVFRAMSETKIMTVIIIIGIIEVKV